MSIVTVTIPQTTLPVGPHVWPVATSNAPVSELALSIDRTVPGGLNSLPSTVRVTLLHEISTDGGTTWKFEAQTTVAGGPETDDQGKPLNTDVLNVFYGRPIPPSGTKFRLTTTVTGQSVVIAGTVTVS